MSKECHHPRHTQTHHHHHHQSPALTHFYTCPSLCSVREGSLEHTDPQAAGAGHAGTLGRHYQCRGDSPHSADTVDGSLEGQRKETSTAAHEPKSNQHATGQRRFNYHSCSSATQGGAQRQDTSKEEAGAREQIVGLRVSVNGFSKC